MYSLIIHLYSLIIELIAPFHKKARTMRLGQWRTNQILRSQIQPGEKYIWFHAASLGEFEQGRPMMEKIKAQYPQYKILLTFFSPSGYEVRKNYAGADVICYLPFDTPYRVNKFLKLAHPVAAVFIKYEFWGNYLAALKKRNIPVYIISAIFRPDLLFFQWFGAPYRKMLHHFTHLYVQDERSKELLAEYGIHNVTVTGDTRFDRVQEVRNQAKDLPLIDKFVHNEKGEKLLTLVAGSSWPQDEQVIIPYFNKQERIKLIIAPHEIHQSHLVSIAALLERPFIRLSEVRSEKDLEGKDCLIIDSFGLLSSIYRYGEMAYIGGGFGVGIHNTVEAAVYGIPVLFGPNHKKFKEAKDLIAVGGGFCIHSMAEFEDKMNEFITQPEVMQAAGKAAGNFVASQVGATDKILSDILPVLKH